MPNEFLAERPPLRLFSVRAVGVGAFVGGPLGAGALIGLNYRRLGNRRAGLVAFITGVVSTGLFFWGLFSLPSEIADRIPRHLIPAVYTPLAAYLAQRLQGDAIKLAIEGGARRASGWAITGWSMASLILTFAAMAPFILMIIPFGFHGEKLSFGPKGVYEVYCEGGVDKAEMKHLADYLEKVGYFKGEDEQMIQVVRRGRDYTLSLPTDRKIWDKSDFMDAMQNIKADLELTILTGKLKIVLVDEDLQRTYKKEL